MKNPIVMNNTIQELIGRGEEKKKQLRNYVRDVEEDI